MAIVVALSHARPNVPLRPHPPSDPVNLAGRAALVTGGGTGIGRAIALALACRGVHLAPNYSRSVDEAEATAAEARIFGVQALALQADVASDLAVRRMVEQAETRFGRLDILVCNAGTTRYAPLADLAALGEPDWDQIMAVNVKGA